MFQMMKLFLRSLLLSSIILLTSVKKNTAQLSLIADGSFEDTVIGWTNYGGQGTLRNWLNLDSSSYTVAYWFYMNYNRTIDSASFSLPNNLNISQDSRYGYGLMYLQIYWECYAPYTSCYANWNNIRSVCKSKLTTKLQAGRKYCAKMYAVTDIRSVNKYYTNGLQMYFDNGELDTVYTIHKDSTGLYYDIPAQVSCPFVINDTVNWMLVQDTFTARGDEEYVYLGNFLRDSQLLRIAQPNQIFLNPEPFHGVAVEDVSLIPIDAANWLQDIYVTDTTTNVWVGLGKFDYHDGIWKNINGTFITKDVGFNFTPTNWVDYFVHEVDVCVGVIKDTVAVYRVPAAIAQNTISNLQILQNGGHQVSIVNSSNAAYHLNVYDITGKLLHKEQCIGSSKIFSLSRFTAGNYIVELSQGKLQCRALVKVIVE
jgi:hypothetical protein